MMSSWQQRLAQGLPAVSTGPTAARLSAPSPRSGHRSAPTAAGVYPSPTAAVVTWSRGRVAHVAHHAIELTEAGVGDVGDGHVVTSAPSLAPATSFIGEVPVSVEAMAPQSPGAIFDAFMDRIDSTRNAEPTA
jgi:hypothetical protein